MPLLGHSQRTEQSVPLVFSQMFKTENRPRESLPAQPYVPPAEKLKTRFSQYAATVCEVAREAGFESNWGRNPENPQTYFVEVFGCTAKRFEQFETEAQKRMIP